MTLLNHRPTIADVAKRAGVSIATVSRVLNQTAQVSGEVASRVQRAIADLHYVPQTAAKNLASKRTNTLGLLLLDLGDEFFASLFRGVEEALTETGYGLLISTYGRNPRHERRSPLGTHNTDGVLVFANSLPSREIGYLHRAGLPMVLLYRTAPESLPIAAVNIDNLSGTRKLIDHLIEVHGYTRIGFLRGYADNEDAHWREVGYRDSLAAHGIEVDESLIADGGFDQADAHARTTTWLYQGRLPDAIFTAADIGAIGVMAALHEAGRQIPGDVAVVGFDDLTISRHLSPPLTTVRAPTERAGYTAATQLVHIIRMGTDELNTLLPTELIVRRSCGCTP